MRQPADLSNAYIDVFFKWQKKGVDLIPPEQTPLMIVKSVCLVCRGSKIKIINGTEHQCLGCKGFGYVLVNQVPSGEMSPEQNRAALNVRAPRSGLAEKIANAIAEYQKKYMETRNVTDLRPMRLIDIAEIVGCKSPTVCIHVKSMDIEGIPAKSMFSSQINGVSNKMVIAALKEMLPLKLTDSEYARMLGEQGMHIHRRTVTKYRLQINRNAI